MYVKNLHQETNKHQKKELEKKEKAQDTTQHRT
jgi:hypothetical protein